MRNRGHYNVQQIAAKAAAEFKLNNQDYRGRSAEHGEGLIGEVMPADSSRL